MSKLLSQEDVQELLDMLGGNRGALKLALDILYIGQLWDDLVDGDQPVGRDNINEAFVRAFRAIPQNPFYINLHPVFQQQLNGLILSAALQFRDSTQLEMGDLDDRMTAFFIRNQVLSVIHFMIGLLGDEEWLAKVGPRFWQIFGLKDVYLEFAGEQPFGEAVYEESGDVAGG